MDLSLIIATRNRPEGLESVLRQLRQQQLAGLSWQVVVVENGADERVESVLRAAQAELPLVWAREQRPGKSHALNRALELATGDLLVLTDDDVTLGAEWLRELWAAAKRWPLHSLFGGTIEPQFPSGTPRWIREHGWCDMWFSRFVRSQPEGPLPTDDLPYPPNLAVRAGALRTARFSEIVGPQPGDYPLGCELELLARLVAAGERAVYVPSARLEHVVRREQLDEQWLLRRCLMAGRGIARWQHDRTSRRIWGRPVWLWLKLAEVWVRHKLSVFRSKRARFDRAGWLQFMKGQVHEYGIIVRNGGDTQ
jgi:glycosyltransferase involved in cell wall biosynthesis